MAHHVPRIARLGAWVLISEGWYKRNLKVDAGFGDSGRGGEKSHVLSDLKHLRRSLTPVWSAHPKSGSALLSPVPLLVF